MRKLVLTLVCAVVALNGLDAQQEPLIPTRHAPLPTDVSQYWYVQGVPGTAAGEGRPNADAFARLTKGVRAAAAADYTSALSLLNGVDLTGSVLADYDRYYTGVALLGLARHAEAETVFSALLSKPREGYLKEAVLLRLADAAIARQEPERAESVLRQFVATGRSLSDEIVLKLAEVEEALSHREHALESYRRIYFESPLSEEAVDAENGIERLQPMRPITADLLPRALRRAERLFTARRWAQARAGFELIAKSVDGEDKALVALRLAECDFQLGRHRAAREGLKPFLKDRSLQAEARYFYLSTIRALGDRATYVSLARDLVEDFPQSEWAAETLNGLASHYLVIDEDAQAEQVFKELTTRFPRHRHSERAAWKAGWAAYRNRQFTDAIRFFETAAAAFPRADYRPSWIYWSGRARDQVNDAAMANERYRLVVADYRNSYYGRLAAALLTTRREPVLATQVTTRSVQVGPSPLPPTEPLIRALTAAQLYDEALPEVQYAQRVWGDNAQLQATTAWIRFRQGLGLRAQDRFTAIRGAITTMRRAYPQFLAAGGEDLPPDILQIIFPLDYWPLIQKYSKQHALDPYLIAALMAQESTFTPEIRSSANARGLMQLIPSTGRRYARKVGLKSFTTASLLQPETNVRLGTEYFKDLVERFGGVHFALAGYNAGEHRVVRWLNEAPGLPTDEFIDNIPFPETQNYVKRIMGTAEDYRRLYGGGLLNPNSAVVATR